MSYKLPPVSHGQFSDPTTQVITDTALAYPVLFGDDDVKKGIKHDTTGVTVTISQANPGVVTYTATAAFPALANGDCIKLTTDGALPTGLTAGVAYFVVNLSGSTFNLAAKPGGTGIQTTSAGSGTHTARCTHRFYLPSTGVWLITYSIIVNSSNPADHIEIWAVQAGSPIARSNTIAEIGKGNAEQVICCAFVVVNTSKDEKFELNWRADGTNSNLLATAAAGSPTRPACPSTIITITKISK